MNDETFDEHRPQRVTRYLLYRSTAHSLRSSLPLSLATLVLMLTLILPHFFQSDIDRRTCLRQTEEKARSDYYHLADI